MSKTLTELVHGTNKRVYVYLSDMETIRIFINNAEKEGFSFSENKRVSDIPLDNFYALNKNSTVNYINFIGRVAYQCGAENILRVDYKKILSQ